jgi:hypothetical protein
MRVAAIVMSTAALVLGPAAPSQACGLFNWLFHGCGTTTFRPVTTYYAPSVCCPTTVCSPSVSCYPTQVCSYVPQTSYRAEVVNVPVTAYRPTVAFDPCTGCATTVYRPVTAFQQQVRYTPVTTYRLSCSPTTTYYAPVVTTADCCAPATISAPTLSSDSGNSSSTAAPSTPQPTFREQSTQRPATENKPLAPIPDKSSGGYHENGATAPSLVPPDSRSTQAPAGGWSIRRAVARGAELVPQVRPAAQASPETLDDGGWRAAR